MEAPRVTGTRSRPPKRAAARARGIVPKRAVALLALAVLAAGIATRVAPIFRHAIWGSDSGEYWFLTGRLLDSGVISFAYDGWGIVYPYFPGMFVVTGATTAVAGIDRLTALQWTVPLLGGLVGLAVLLITHAATRNRVAALVAGGAAAVLAPNVLVTSHAMPGTLGHLLVLGGLLATWRARDDPRFAWFLVPLVPALTVTHHLSLYFLVGVVAGNAFLRELGSASYDRRALAVEVPLVVASVALAAVWWLGVSDRMREDIVGDAFKSNPWLTALVFVVALAALPALVAAKRRLAPALLWRARVDAPPRAAFVVLAFVVVFYALIATFRVTGVPGTNIRIGAATFVYLLPVVPFLALAVLGSGASRATRAGFALWGWMAAILVSVAMSAATNNKVLFPFRHVDYLMEALAALAGVGAVVVLGYAEGRADPTPHRRAAVAGIVLLLALGAFMSEPPRSAYGGFEEGMSDAEFAAVLWARDHLPEGATIAADHRDSSLLFGFAGLRASWDYTPRTYHGESWEDVEAELRSLDIPSGNEQRIDYVFLSPEIREGVTLLQWENSAPMSDAAYRKFFTDPHFEAVYAEDGVYIFRIRWDLATPASA